MPKLKKQIKITGMDYEAQRYCFKKGFLIYPEVVGNDLKIVYQRGHKKQYYQKGKTFSKAEAYQAIWDLYKKIYKHYKNN